eukprot:6373298-Prymnesium_polylepis.2
MVNEGLEQALKGKAETSKTVNIEFTRQEWQALNVADLRAHQFIRAGNSYFKPTRPVAEGELGAIASKLAAYQPPKGRDNGPSDFRF